MKTIHPLNKSGRAKDNAALGIASMALLSALLTGCGSHEKSESIAELQKRHGVPVRVMRISRGEVRSIERAGGTVEGYYQTTLNAGVAGTIRSIRTRVGAKVSKGAVLATIAPDMASPYVIRKAQYEQASKSRRRVKALAQEGGVSQEVLDQVETGYAVAKEHFDAAKKTVNIVAPFAGTVIDILEPPQKKVKSGKKLIKLARLDKIRITIDINEALISRFRKGQKAFVVLNGDTVYGDVEKVAIGAKEKGHFFPVDVILPNPNRLLKPGMYVTVNVIVIDMKDVLTAPTEVIMRDNDGAFVYVIEGEIARKAHLNLGIRGGDRMSIDEGVSEGQQVVVEGAGLLSEGVKVKIVD